jgi:hypothetical protein
MSDIWAIRDARLLQEEQPIVKDLREVRPFRLLAGRRAAQARSNVTAAIEIMPSWDSAAGWPATCYLKTLRADPYRGEVQFHKLTLSHGVEVTVRFQSRPWADARLATRPVDGFFAGSACSRTAGKSSLCIFIGGVLVSAESVRFITASA